MQIIGQASWGLFETLIVFPFMFRVKKKKKRNLWLLLLHRPLKPRSDCRRFGTDFEISFILHTHCQRVSEGTRQSHKKYNTLHLLYWVVREDTNLSLFVVLKRHVKRPDADFHVSKKKKKKATFRSKGENYLIKLKSEDNLTKTKVNMGQQHGQVNSGSLNGVQSLPPGCELKKRNVRCQQKNTRRWIEWVDTPSKEKKKKKQTCPTAFCYLIRQCLPLNHLTRTVTSLLFFYTNLLGNWRKDINPLTWHDLVGVSIWRKCKIWRRY